MKISYITMQFPAPSEAFASLDINTLKKLNIDVDVYCLRPKHKKHRLLISQRKHYEINIYMLGVKSFFESIIFIFCSPLKLFKILKWIITTNRGNVKHIIKSIILLPSIFYIFKKIKINKPDLIHLFWGHYPSMLLYLVHNYLPTIPFTIFLGAHDLEEKYAGSLYMCKYSKKIFTHALENVDDLISFGINKEKIKVLHRGTIINKKCLISEKREIEKEVIFLTASRLIKEKGVADVIEIFYKFYLKHNNSKLYIAGEGIDLKRLQKLVKRFSLAGNVEFLGHISQEKLFDYMNKSHYFILMTRYHAERLPNVIKESMLRKCIAITTPTIGINELINHGQDGFIFNNNDDISTILEELMKNKRQITVISNNAMKKIKNNFNVLEIMKKYIIIWKSIVKEES